MSSLHRGVAALAFFAFALSSMPDASDSRAVPEHKDPVVGLAQGVMTSFGAHVSPAQSADDAKFAIDPQTGQAIYLPTGEVIDEVIPVTASRGDRALSATRAASTASEPTHASLPDGGIELPARRDAGPSAT